MDRRAAIMLGLLVIVLIAVGLALTQGSDEAPATPPPPPRPAAKVVEPAPSNGRLPLRRPADIEAAEPPDERAETSRVDADMRREMNYAMDGVLRTARRECLDPWLARIDAPPTNEFVFDAVLWEGRLVDFGMRSLGPEVPEDVVSCVADAVWYGDWPEWDLTGELRLQRSIEVRTE